MDLFQRAWCIAEIAEAKRHGMRQSLKLVSKQGLLQHKDSLRKLDIERMHCYKEHDREVILKRIKAYVSIPRFNEQLQSLIFDPRAGLISSEIELLVWPPNHCFETFW